MVKSVNLIKELQLSQTQEQQQTLVMEAKT